jgi:hypothetical protein
MRPGTASTSKGLSSDPAGGFEPTNKGGKNEKSLEIMMVTRYVEKLCQGKIEATEVRGQIGSRRSTELQLALCKPL